MPVLADIDAATLNIRVEEIEKRHHAADAGDRSRALRRASRRTSIRCSSSPQSRGIAVLEDAAHAVGTEYKGRRIGSFPTTSVFSFHPNKNITTGEGGMVVTEDEDVFEKASLLKFHGMDREAWKRFAKAGSPRYDVAVPGLQVQHDGHPGGARPPPAAAARRLPRRARAPGRARTTRPSPGCAGLILPQRRRLSRPARLAPLHAAVDIDRLTIDRDAFMAELKKRNIGTGLHYTAAHEFSYYASGSAGSRRISRRRTSSRSGSSRCRSSRA